ncbi:hypothetical protein BC628DRAFT_370449 [Trametes gibbosa]|nr:hypothetical protein BC628DRAFT_370449 [Trametes gibbosa]
MSKLPPAASSAPIAASRVAPRPMSISTDTSGCRLSAPPGTGWPPGAPGPLPAAAGEGADPRICPLPGKGTACGAPAFCEPDAPAAPAPAVDEPDGPVSVSSWPEFMMRAFSGSSCSARKRTSRPWIRRTFFSRSMHAWCALSMSRPNSRSTSRPSMIVNEQGRKRSASFS